MNVYQQKFDDILFQQQFIEMFRQQLRHEYYLDDEQIDIQIISKILNV
jgi:20S proteasome alpha/beta subunit